MPMHPRHDVEPTLRFVASNMTTSLLTRSSSTAGAAILSVLGSMLAIAVIAIGLLVVPRRALLVFGPSLAGGSEPSDRRVLDATPVAAGTVKA
jgi:hypothetical protein